MRIGAYGAVCVGIILAAGCSGNGKSGSAVAPPVVTGVITEAVAEGTAMDFFPATGTVRAAVTAPIAARIAGTVDAVFVRDGMRVPKGKVLVVLKADETVSGASGAEAAVEEARRGVEEAKARKKLAEETYSRYQTLYAEQAATRQEFETRQMERDVAVQGLSRAEARLLQARENAKTAGTLAGYARITAPIAGVVTGKSIDRGATVFPGTTLLTIEGEGRYRLEAYPPDNLSQGLKVGEPVKVTVDGVSGELAGKISEMAPMADSTTRTRLVKIDINGESLRSGMYGRAFFPAGKDKGFFIPKRAVVERGTLNSVWVVTGGVAHMRLIKTGREMGERVEVLSGLSKGERVVVGGGEKVVEGARVQ